MVWIIITVAIMTVLCFLISLLARKFLRGPTLVLVTVPLTTVIMLTGLAAGMAEGDFTFGVVLPYLICAVAIASVWLLGMKARATKG